MAVAGSLYPPLSKGERHVVLTSPTGRSAVHLSGLRAWDATGRDLRASFELSSSRMAIVVDDEAAVYPVTVDPWIWAETANLFASDAAVGDRFGIAVSLSGSTALIGANGKDTGTIDEGCAYILEQGPTGWSEQARIVPTALTPRSDFGHSASLDGDTALIGATGHFATGMIQGAAFVHVRSSTSWTQEAMLYPVDGYLDELFGFSVSLSKDTALVGAPFKSDLAHHAGAAYVFVRTGTAWTQQAKLVPADSTIFDYCGWSVALDGGTALIGAKGRNDGAGAAFVFTRTGTLWQEVAKLEPTVSSGLGNFGWNVSLSGDTALVGQWNYHQGEVHVFVGNSGSWARQAVLAPEDPSSTADFGCGIDVSGEVAVVGARYFQGIGINSGAAYEFVRSGTNWTRMTRLLASDASAGDVFGTSVSLSGRQMMVGAVGDDPTGTGVATGGVYVFDRRPIPGLIENPAADFTSAPTAGDEDLLVVFSSISTGTGLVGFAWDFGDGGTDSAANPVHTYVEPGTYTVSLTVTGTHGSDTKTKADHIVVHDVVETSATPYNGSGINPNLLVSITLPVLGTTWNADIDGGSIGAAGISFLVGYSAPVTGLFTGLGELLIDVTSNWMLTDIAGGASGVSHHTLAIPNDPTLAGLHAFVQGLLNNVGGSGQLTNAYELEFGY